MFKHQLFKGNVYHKRFSPKVHDFRYSSYFVKLSLANLYNNKPNFFSINGINLFSFNFLDHGYRDGNSLFEFAKDQLSLQSIDTDFDDIVIHTYPRILGYVFNPVSFWYIYKKNTIKAILAEVNNTFGETKTYLLTPDNQTSVKAMQVSPFNQIEGHYEFKFLSDPEFEKVEIKYFKNDQLIILATIEGRAFELNSANLIKTFLTNPFYNIGAVILIHFEALRLWIKGVPFFGKNGVISDN